MWFSTRADSRPYHLGTYPLEGLPRDPSVAMAEAALAPIAAPAYDTPAEGPLAAALRDYLGIFAANAVREPAAARAPVPDDPQRRMVDVKGYAYFMNASQVGICRLPDNAWCRGAERPAGHDHAVVLLLAHGRVPEQGNPARDWVAPAVREGADCRIGGIAVCLAGHIAQLGWSAEPHVVGAGSVDAERLAVLAGLAVRDPDSGRLRNPYVDAFSLAVVTTDYALAVECLPRKEDHAKDLALWGIAAFLGTMFGPCISGPLLSYVGKTEDPQHYSPAGYNALMITGVVYSLVCGAVVTRVSRDHKEDTQADATLEPAGEDEAPDAV